MPVLRTPDQERDLLNALMLKCRYGWQQLQDEPTWPGIQDTIHFINGHHHLVDTRAKSKVYLNRVRKVHNELCAVLTDVRPIGSYETQRQKSTDAERVLSHCNRWWWRTQKTDRVLRDVLSLSAIAGSGYLLLTHYPDEDDIVPEAIDTRDVIPIEPTYGGGVQSWRGACVRKRVPISDAHRMFPEKKAFLKEQSGNSWFGPETTRVSGIVKRVVSSFWENVMNRKRRSDPPGVEIMFVYYKDDSLNESDEVVEMGEPGTNWAYTVPPGGRLYPRGHLVICTSETILWDGPNRYWHAKVPLIKFTLMPAHWTINGLSVIQDILAMQHSLNESVRGLDDARNKILDPDVIADRRALTEDELRKIDARMPGGRYHVDTTLLGAEGFRFGEPPNLGNYYLAYLQFLLDQIDDVSGVRGIQAFLQYKQMPSKDTLQEFMNGMSPMLRDMARSLEVSVLEMAELMLYNFFQFYGTDKRMEILGEEGLAPEDFEGDSADLVPSGEGTTEERARRTAKQFRFSVAPNTFLNMSNVTGRMMKYQLWSGGGLSTRSVWEAFDIPNIGPPQGNNEAEQMVWERRNGLLQGSPPELVQAQLAAAVAQAQAAIAQMGLTQMGVNPGQAPVPEGQQPGGGVPRGPGRPAEGIDAPQLESKDGGTRQTVTTSR